mgnify:CR=1 FL=1
MSELILYTSDDGQTRLHLRVETDSIWLSQLDIAELFQTTKQNVSLHAHSVVKESLTVQNKGGRQGQHKRHLSHG